MNEEFQNNNTGVPVLSDDSKSALDGSIRVNESSGQRETLKISTDSPFKNLQAKDKPILIQQDQPNQISIPDEEENKMVKLNNVFNKSPLLGNLGQKNEKVSESTSPLAPKNPLIQKLEKKKQKKDNSNKLMDQLKQLMKSSQPGSPNAKESSSDDFESADLSQLESDSDKNPFETQAGTDLLLADACQCSICVNLTKNEEKFTNIEPLDIYRHFQKNETDIVHSRENKDGHIQSIKLELKDFSWIMHKLLPPEGNTSICGCEVRFVDTAFFDAEPGKAQDILKTDSNGCLVQITMPHKLSTAEIRTNFSLTVRERWKQQELPADSDIFAKFRPKTNALQITNMLKRQLAMRFSQVLTPTDSGGNDPDKLLEKDDKDTRHRDQVILRYKKGFGPSAESQIKKLMSHDQSDKQSAVQPLTEHEFIQTADKRANDPFWQTISCIQTTGKNSRGLGKHIHIPFRCRNVFHVNDIFDDKKVVFDYQSADSKYYKEIEEQAKKINQVAEKAFSYHEIQREIEYRM